MFIRAVRFTDVDSAKLESMLARIGEADGPPEGVVSSGIQMLHDTEQGTAVVLQLFETEENMRQSEAVFEAMDPSDTPGTRASVDRGEVKLDLHM